MKNYRLIDCHVIGDKTGSLIAIEGNQDIPFDIKRVYYIFDTQANTIRGKHAHRNLQQMIICVSGECDFILDDGYEKETIHLDSPKQGLYLSSHIWREFTNFSLNCVVMVLASEHYNPSDYINDYTKFIEETRK